MTAQAILVPKNLETVSASDVARLGPVHVPDMAGQCVPGQLLFAEGTSLLLGHGSATSGGGSCGGGGRGGHSVSHRSADRGRRRGWNCRGQVFKRCREA